MADSIFIKLSKIREMVEALQKDSSGFGYKYVSEAEILSKVTAGIKKYKIDYYPSIVPGTAKVLPYYGTKVKVTKNGDRYEDNINDVLVSADMEYTWVNLEDSNDTYRVPWIVVGQQADASQAFGSGLTYCSRYFLLKFFKSSTMESDPDSWRAKQQEALDAERREIAAEIIKTVDEICKTNTTDENKDDLIALIKGIVKKNGKASADYSSVIDPIVAGKLLEELTKFFKLEEK